mgnify:CR=1 FL=1
MGPFTRLWVRSVLVVTTVIGGAALLGFVGFLLMGPLVGISLGLDPVSLLFFDGALCLGFFVQHSVMIRKSFRLSLSRFCPQHFHGAVYAVASGLVLLALVILWQESGQTLLSLDGGLRLLARLASGLALLGFVWGVSSLRGFDTFGLRPIKARLRGKDVPNDGPIVIKGAYRWVRHPLYFLMLVLFWSFPDLTSDRLLFNLSWTGWVVVGTYLEERDLVAKFGDAYLDYQAKVPMLIPWKRGYIPLH